MVSWLPLNISDPLLSFPFQPVCCHFVTLVSPSLWGRVLSRTGSLQPGTFWWDPLLVIISCFPSSFLFTQYNVVPSLLLLIPHPSAICVHYAIAYIQDTFLSFFLSFQLCEKQLFSMLTLLYRMSTCSAFLPTSPEHSDWTTRGQSSFSSTGSRLGRS